MKKESKRMAVKSFFIALAIEAIVLAITIIPMAEGFMTHSAIAAARRGFVSQIVGGFGILFHLPAGIIGFSLGGLFGLDDYSIFLILVVQIVLLTLLVFLRSKILDSLKSDNLHFD